MYSLSQMLKGVSFEEIIATHLKDYAKKCVAKNIKKSQELLKVPWKYK